MASDSVPKKQGKKIDSTVFHFEGLFYLQKGIYKLFFPKKNIYDLSRLFLREKYSRESRCIGEFFPDGRS